MKILTALLTSLFLFACDATPVIIPDSTVKNPILNKLNYDIQNGDKISSGWGWILWYLPIVAVVVLWAYNHLWKNCKEETTDSENKQ